MIILDKKSSKITKIKSLINKWSKFQNLAGSKSGLSRNECCSRDQWTWETTMTKCFCAKDRKSQILKHQYNYKKLKSSWITSKNSFRVLKMTSTKSLTKSYRNLSKLSAKFKIVLKWQCGITSRNMLNHFLRIELVLDGLIAAIWLVHQ